MKFITKEAYDTPAVRTFNLEASCSIMAESAGFSTEEVGDDVNLFI